MSGSIRFNPHEVRPNLKQREFLGAVNERRVLTAKSMLNHLLALSNSMRRFTKLGQGADEYRPDLNSEISSTSHRDKANAN